MIGFELKDSFWAFNGLRIEDRVMRAMLCFSLLFLANTFATAQTACPQGVPPGDPRCGPSPSWHQGQTAPEESTAPRIIVRERFQVWEDRFGAIATDEKGPFGVSEGQKTEEAARQLATQDCIGRGGDPIRCQRMGYTYSNSCVAFVWGSGRGEFASGGDVAGNERRAFRACEEATGAACHLIYSGCSRSVDVGFCPKGIRPPHPSCGPPKR